MRRKVHTPQIDMVPMMGLCAVLIALLVTASETQIAVIDTDIQPIWSHPPEDPVLVPTVVLYKDGIRIELPDHDHLEVDTIQGITAALNAIRKEHPSNGNWILVPSADVLFDDLVGAMDAARAAQFPYVTIAGGPA